MACVGGGRKEEPRTSLARAPRGGGGGRSSIPTLLQEMELVWEGLSGKEAPLANVTWALYLCLILGPATYYLCDLGQAPYPL